ncbi:hypothetical protein MRX96_018121 [Rhipicephalus microplus]
MGGPLCAVRFSRPSLIIASHLFGSNMPCLPECPSYAYCLSISIGPRRHRFALVLLVPFLLENLLVWPTPSHRRLAPSVTSSGPAYFLDVFRVFDASGAACGCRHAFARHAFKPNVA